MWDGVLMKEKKKYKTIGIVPVAIIMEMSQEYQETGEIDIEKYKKYEKYFKRIKPR